MRKVYFSYLNITNRASIHPIFRDTLDNPPKGYIYVNRDSFTGTNNTIVQSPLPMRIAAYVARRAKKIISLPTIWKLPAHGYDLAHVSSHLAITSKPWVFDFENIHCLTQFNPVSIRKRHVKAIARRYLGKAAHLIAMSEGARKSMLHIFPEFAGRTSVVYPAPTITKAMRRTYERRMALTAQNKEITFLFAARYFRKKGGYETIEAFKLVREKHPHARLLVVADRPPDIEDVDGMEFVGRVDREDMISIYYPRADVFVYPTFYDTFGYVILEAMAFGIPSISTTDNVIPELVDDGFDGLLVPGYEPSHVDEWHILKPQYMDFERIYSHTREQAPRMAKDIAAAMERFLREPDLVREMGKRCYEKVTSGPFSLRERRKRLGEIYDRALADGNSRIRHAS